METKKVRVGMIGVAVDRPPKVHLRALKSMEDVELAAFCDIDQAVLDRACQEYGVKEGFLDRRKMLEKAQIDAVWVVCNWRFTYEVALDCLNAGLNTFLEKPPGLSTQECRDLAEAAAKSGCQSMVGFNRRFNRVIDEAKRLVAGPATVGTSLGVPQVVKVRAKRLTEGPASLVTAVSERRTIQVVASDYGKPRFPAPLADKDGRPVAPLQIDAIHHVDALRYLCGEPEKVMSVTTRHYSDNLDSFHALIKFKNGAIGHFNSNYHALKVEKLSLFATNAWASLQGVQDQISQGRVYADGCWHELKGEALMGRTDILGFWDEDRFFINCVKEKKTVGYPASGLNDAIKTMELVDAILAGG